MAIPPALLHDIRGPLPGEEPIPFLWTALVLLLFLAIRIWPRRRPPAVAAVAEAALGNLLAEYRQGGCPAEDFLLRLDPLFRQAIATASGLPAPCLDSRELAAALAARGGDPAELLALFDRVKFAAHEPGREEADWAAERVTALLADLAGEDGV